MYGRSCVRRRRDRQMDDIDSRGTARLALRRRRRSVAFRRLLSLALFLYFPLFSLYLSHIRPNFVRTPLPPPPGLFKSRRRDGRRWRRHIPLLLLLLRITRKDAPARTNGTPFPRAVTRTRSHARTHARASRGTHALREARTHARTRTGMERPGGGRPRDAVSRRLSTAIAKRPAPGTDTPGRPGT